MGTLADRRLAQLSAESDAHLARALALEAKGLPISARQQINAALVAQRKMQTLRSLMDRHRTPKSKESTCL
jgi:hypothetical protein